MTMQNLQGWVGRETTTQDLLRAEPARFMQATLDRAPSLVEGDPLPPLWHWLYFLEAIRASELGRDAHPKKGGFLPPVSLPRRMWAGGRFTFAHPLILGKETEKRSRILSVTEKEGRTGKLCFVTVLHEIFQEDTLSVTEEHDIVYREDPSPEARKPAPTLAPASATLSETVTPTEVMLFRYSALTFNGHRIHYDTEYARHVEGYDGLVFHGPLIATLLIDLACAQMGLLPKAFSFRGVSPISGKDPFHIEGTQIGRVFDLWARKNDGSLATTARAEF